MTVELGDERSFKRAMADRVEEYAQESIMDAIETAKDESVRMLLESTPPPEASMDEWRMEDIAESATIQWNDAEEIAVLEFEHPHADKIEVGVKPHEIEGNPWLVWEDRETGETIFRQKVHHPGIPAVGYLRAGFRRALNQHFD